MKLFSGCIEQRGQFVEGSLGITRHHGCVPRPFLVIVVGHAAETGYAIFVSPKSLSPLRQLQWLQQRFAL